MRSGSIRIGNWPLILCIYAVFCNSKILNIDGSTLSQANWVERGTTELSTSDWTEVQTKFADFKFGLVFPR